MLSDGLKNDIVLRIVFMEDVLKESLKSCV